MPSATCGGQARATASGRPAGPWVAGTSFQACPRPRSRIPAEPPDNAAQGLEPEEEEERAGYEMGSAWGLPPSPRPPSLTCGTSPLPSQVGCAQTRARGWRLGAGKGVPGKGEVGGAGRGTAKAVAPWAEGQGCGPLHGCP